jgi:hypothetical protein
MAAEQTIRTCGRCGGSLHHRKTRQKLYCSRSCAARMRTPPKSPDRFWEQVSKGALSECWLWTGATNSKGYGRYRRVGSPEFLAHRVSWTRAHGAIPDGLVVCHHCDTPRCVNPAHLFLGTRSDNTQDSRKKGRNNRGQRNGQARLTDAIVTALRERHGNGERCADMAVEFGCSIFTVMSAVKGRTWTHLPLTKPFCRQRPRTARLVQ